MPGNIKLNSIHVNLSKIRAFMNNVLVTFPQNIATIICFIDN